MIEINNLMPGGAIRAIKKSEARQRNREGLRSGKCYFRERNPQRAFC